MTLTVDPAALVANLGFLVRRDIPALGQDALLVVALRKVPTERHFDPELLLYWRSGPDGRGHRAEMTQASRMPRLTEFSWGPIEIVDRFGIANTFLSFGGSLAADRDPDGDVIATFRSRGPILRRGGHSQRYDSIAAAVAGFFGRLLVPIDFQPGAERVISAATPVTRYAAFLQHEVPRLAIELVREAYGADARLLHAEAERLRLRDPRSWEDGAALLSQLGLGATAA
ncbi:MAG TPA: hypothetical protein VLA59_04375 [Patescibacteria group bacterium]|nr:hypothetical protein [Patescibacteria group bacterium]